MSNTVVDINEVNKTLFETLKGVKNGEIKPEIGKAVNSIATTLVNSARVQLDAAKNLKEFAPMGGILGLQIPSEEKTTEGTVEIIKIPEMSDNQLTKLRLEFSIDNGYKTIANAIEGFNGSFKFENAFKKWVVEYKASK